MGHLVIDSEEMVNIELLFEYVADRETLIAGTMLRISPLDKPSP